MFIIWLKNSAY